MLLNNKRIKTIEPFLKNYNIKLTGSEIAKKQDLNQKSVSLFLRELEKNNILKKTTQGKNKLYCLNIEDIMITKSFISAVENIRTMNFYKEKPLIKEICKKIKKYNKGIMLIFGSYAKRKEKEDSDLDVLIAGKYNKKQIKKISKIYQIEINVKNYSPEDFCKLLKESDFLAEEVIKDHIIVNNTDGFISVLLECKYEKDSLVPENKKRSGNNRAQY
ncbi:nucleotidyltransferase domain-containing protein [Candidatus Woesearchaeota archaeon]|nr:nucleotidyltransferase domain-containing protein [Candidatus Woesearchaeota archaeon]